MKLHADSLNVTTGVLKKNEFYKLEIHCPNLSPFDSVFMVRRSGIICGPIWGSFPVRGSFAVQFGDHLRAGIICGPVQVQITEDLSTKCYLSRTHCKSSLIFPEESVASPNLKLGMVNV